MDKKNVEEVKNVKFQDGQSKTIEFQDLKFIAVHDYYLVKGTLDDMKKFPRSEALHKAEQYYTNALAEIYKAMGILGIKIKDDEQRANS